MEGGLHLNTITTNIFASYMRVIKYYVIATQNSPTKNEIMKFQTNDVGSFFALSKTFNRVPHFSATFYKLPRSLFI